MFKPLTNKIYKKLSLGVVCVLAMYVLVGYLSTIDAAPQFRFNEFRDYSSQGISSPFVSQAKNKAVNAERSLLELKAYGIGKSNQYILDRLENEIAELNSLIEENKGFSFSDLPIENTQSITALEVKIENTLTKAIDTSAAYDEEARKAYNDQQDFKQEVSGSTQGEEATTQLSGVVKLILGIIADILVSVNTVFAHALGAVSVLLNTSIEFFVIKFSATYAYFEDSISNAWTVFRDISNILIIALFFAVAIGIIVGSEKIGDKALLIKLFIVAILVNFSAFFTKVLIDLSNIAILFFYSKVVGGTSLPAVLLDSGSVIALGNQRFFEEAAGEGSIVIAAILKMALLVFYIFLFIYLAIAFVLRFLILLFAIILSPIGIVGFFLNKIEIGFP